LDAVFGRCGSSAVHPDGERPEAKGEKGSEIPVRRRSRRRGRRWRRAETDELVEIFRPWARTFPKLLRRRPRRAAADRRAVAARRSASAQAGGGGGARTGAAPGTGQARSGGSRPQAEAELRAAQAPPAEAPNIQIQSDDHRALADATRHADAILPRMHAMCVPLSPLPILPMPGGDRSHHPGAPLRAKLRDRKEVRDALVAQTFLQPAKGLAL
jgi:hypothetical protein